MTRKRQTGGPMRNGGFAPMILLAVCGGIAALMPVAAQSGSSAGRYTGTWSGSWEGGGSGDFELTLDQKDGAPAGKVAVTTDAGPYTADLTAVTFDGAKMTAKYDFPLDTSGEVVLAATFEERTAKGTWSLRPKGQDTEILSGTWTVAKK